MSITAADILQAFQGLTPEQRQQILDLSSPRTPVMPGPRHNLRQMPSKQHNAPHFTHETDWKDHLPTSAYPQLLWHQTTGQEVTAHDAEEEAKFGSAYARFPKGAADPVDALKALYDSLSEEDKAYMREFEQKQRRAKLEAALNGLTPDQIASVAVPVKKAARA